MPRKTSKPKNETKQSRTKKTAKTAKTTKSTKSDKTVTDEIQVQVKPVVETKTEVEVDECVDVKTEPVAVVKRKRVKPTREIVDSLFDKLQGLIKTEIDTRREAGTRNGPGIKFLRTINSQLKTIHATNTRVLKAKQPSTRKGNNNSGFLKPVKLSPEMAKFTGWNPDELKSRVDVTKFICDYIRENELQNPSDRREILVDKDSKLKKLLHYSKKKDPKPLTYYSLQTYIKPHFKKE